MSTPPGDNPGRGGGKVRKGGGGYLFEKAYCEAPLKVKYFKGIKINVR